MNIFRLIKKTFSAYQLSWISVFNQYNQSSWEPVFTRPKRVRLNQFSLVQIANAFAREVTKKREMESQF